MSATAYIAIYAAAIATGGLGWQVWTQVRRRRPSLRLRVGHAACPSADLDLAGKLVYRVTVSVANTGETTETVEAIGFEVLDHTHGVDERPLREPLPPGGVVAREWDLLALSFDPTPGIVPFVQIASKQGKAFGDPEPLLAEFIAEDCWPVYDGRGAELPV